MEKPYDIEYLRGVIARAKNTANISFWVSQEEWADWLSWALDEIEDLTELLEARPGTATRLSSPVKWKKVGYGDRMPKGM